MSDAAPPEHYETFVRLFVSHEARLRGFVRSLLNNWDSVDEVMQETSLVAWRKFAQFDPSTNFMAWAAAIARFESLKYLRRQSRERLVFNDDILDLLAEESLEDTEHLEQQRAALSSCLAKLDSRQKDLLQLAYQPGVKFHEVAAQAGKSTQAFYKTIQRLRANLLTCAERQLKQSGASA
jgi:RNA polymerase sigma-70 factor (ECF subfamily)